MLDVRWTPWIIDKITDFWKIILEFSQYQKCIEKGSWVSWTLATRLRNYKFHWVWRDVGGTPGIIKRMTYFCKNLLNFSQCQKCIDKASRVSWTLVTWLGNYKLFYFESFTQIGVMSDERFELSIKWRTFGKLFWGLVNS